MRDDSTVQFGHATAIRVAVRSSVMQVSSVEIVVKQRQEGPGKIKSAKDKVSYHSRQSATRYSPTVYPHCPLRAPRKVRVNHSMRHELKLGD